MVFICEVVVPSLVSHPTSIILRFSTKRSHLLSFFSVFREAFFRLKVNNWGSKDDDFAGDARDEAATVSIKLGSI